MSYLESGSLLQYFAPNIPLATTDSGVLQEVDIGAASADHGEYVCFKACKVVRLAFALTGELAGGTTTAPTVVFTKRPTPLSATGETAVGTLTVPEATAVGKVVFKDIDGVSFNVGDSLEIAHTIGVGTPTGQGHAYFECNHKPEDALNVADMVASV